jgi:hypothetical protein
MRVARDGHWTHIGYCTGETSVPWLGEGLDGVPESGSEPGAMTRRPLPDDRCRN